MNFSAYAKTSRHGLLAQLGVLPKKGLTKKEVTKRKEKYGANEIIGGRVRWWQVLLRQFRTLFVYLLLAAALLALFLGVTLDALVILAFITINAILGFYQEYRSEQTLKLLKKYIQHKVRVLRDGQEIIINSQGLVPSDLVFLEAGDIIPADIRFITEHNLLVDESVLTGESIPVKKQAIKLDGQISQFYQALNLGFSGTTVVGGQGLGVVFATGSNTAIGEVSQLVSKNKKESSFEKGIKKFSRFILFMVAISLVIVFVLHLLIKGGEIKTIELFIFAIALIVGVIPEALPLVMTFSLSSGALHLAKNKVVVKRLSAIEDLGDIEVLCSDKTGTLTENKLVVAEINSPDPQKAIFYACLASQSYLKNKKQIENPFDLALKNRLTANDQLKIIDYKRISSLPFDPERRRNSIIVKKGAKTELISRGAPEALIPFVTNLDKVGKRSYDQWAVNQGKMGRRVIAIAKRDKFSQIDYNQKAEEKNLFLLGLVSFTDPIKTDTKEAIKKALNLGVKIKILTGDSKEVAGVVAKEVGIIKSADQVITGEKLEKMPFAKQKTAIEGYAVFARVSPQQKYKIIQSLQTKEQVGFLGEGINDAPALKIANVGLAVSEATDIARESADIILLRKSLNVIIDGIKHGREVFANTTKYIKSTLTSNFGNFYALAFVSLFIDFLPMLPLQILLVNLLSDFPMISVATDNVDPEELHQPKGYNIKEVVTIATVLGVVSTVFDFIFFGLFRNFGEAVLQTAWFTGSILTELILIFSIRTRLVLFKVKRPSLALIGLTIFAAAATIIIPLTHFGQNIFKFTRLANKQLLLILGIVLVYFFITEIVKLIYYKFFHKKSIAAG